MFRYMVTRPSRLFPAALLVLMLAGAISGQQPTQPSTSQASSRVDQANALVAEGAADLERGLITEARTLFQRALKIDPKNGAAHTYLGVLADQTGQLNEAESNFAAAVLADPASPATHNNYGAILIKLGRKKQAAAQFEISLHLNPNQPSALVNLAQIRFSESTIEGLSAARELFERAQATAPDVETSRALVVIALRLHDSKSAASSYRSFVEQLSKA
jgi:Tfp pilus assembly protein PilF